MSLNFEKIFLQKVNESEKIGECHYAKKQKN